MAGQPNGYAPPGHVAQQGPSPGDAYGTLGRLTDDMYLENNRYYCKFPRGAYMYPCDEQERNRLDIMNKFFLVARKEALHSAPLHPLPPGERHHVLDLGTGTGIWAIDMAMRYENALVDGVDLIMIQPEQIFANQRFMLMDVESEWTVVRDGYHLIFARMLNGAISNWPRVYRNVFNHLKPGGWFEQVEIDWTPRCDDSSLPPNSALERWAHEVSSAMRQANRPISVDTAQTRAALADAGFVDFGEEIIQIPYNGWPDDPHDRQVGRWFNLSLYEGIQALSLAPLTRVKGWSPAQVEALLAQVKDEIRRRGYNGHHAYCYMHIYTARRP